MRRSTRLASKPRLDYKTLNSTGKKVAKLTKPVKAAVNKLINSKKEKKFATRFSGDVGFNSSISATEVYQLVPALPQGVGQNQRIGDSVRPTSLIVNVSIRATGYQSALVAMGRLFIIEDLTNSTAQGITVNPDMNQLLDAGNNVHAYDGTHQWEMVPVNRNRFKVHTDKTFKIEKGYGEEANVGNSYISPQQCISTHQQYHFKIRVPLKKVWKYDNDADSYPSNQSIWLCMGYVNASGTVDVTTQAISATFNSAVYFTDA